MSWVWWFVPVIQALERWRQKDQKFKAILSFIVSQKSIRDT